MTCETGKVEYASRTAAARALRGIRNPQGRMHVYRCGNHWHLGHSNRIDGGKVGTVHGGHRASRRPYAGFILAGAHQVVFGHVCVTCARLDAPDRRAVQDLDLPDDLLEQVTAAGDQRVIGALLQATPSQLEEITDAWNEMRSDHQRRTS